MKEGDRDLESGEATGRSIVPRVAPEDGWDDRGVGISSQPKYKNLSDKFATKFIFLMVLLVSVVTDHGCGRGGPEAVADHFMESYYSAANLEDALRVADGLAAKKIADQQLLLGGRGGNQEARGRRVSYTRTEKAMVDGKLFFRYEIRIDVQGGGSFTRKSLLAMSHAPNGWRVTNFSEFE